MTNRDEQQEFERYVRRVARARFDLPPTEGGPDYLLSREFDCICDLKYVVIAIEATASRTKEKIIHDADKLDQLGRQLKRQNRAFTPYIVTLHEPTDHQRAAAKLNNVAILSIREFETPLFDPVVYIRSRENYPFGSAADPDTDGPRLSEPYVAAPFDQVSTNTKWNIKNIADGLSSAKHFVATGQFGAGKSVAVAQLFSELSARHYKNHLLPIPVAINLRDHWGDEYAEELFFKHGRKIGLPDASGLVRAWHAGRLVLLLDGFDELAAPVWSWHTNRRRDLRRKALQAVRELIENSRGKCGVLVTGRNQYFDTVAEMNNALGVNAQTVHLELPEFDDAQARRYLRSKGIKVDLPAWLPRKPLLLGYLAVENLLEQLLSIPGHGGPAAAWDQFLLRISEREARLGEEIDGTSVRAILELLAHKARQTPDGTGPLSPEDLAAAFQSITGTNPEESAQVILQRLPGLTIREREEQSRQFVDSDMLDALAGGYLSKIVTAPHTFTDSGRVKHPMQLLGLTLCSKLCFESGLSGAAFNVAAETLAGVGESTVAFECLLAGSKSNVGLPLDCRGIKLTNGIVAELDFSQTPVANVSLQEFLITHLDISEGLPSGVSINDSLIQRISGAASPQGLPKWITNTEVEVYDDVLTTAGIMRMEMPTGIRVGLTILKKLYLQPGGGRLESAMYRGLPEDIRGRVPSALAVLAANKLAFSSRIGGNTIWHAARGERPRVLSILTGPSASEDPILEDLKKL